MTCAVDVPLNNQTSLNNIDIMNIEIPISPPDNSVLVSGVDLTSFLNTALLQQMQVLTPIERFLAHMCPREAVFVLADPNPIEQKPRAQHRGRVGKRKTKKAGRKSGTVKAQGSTVGTRKSISGLM